MATIEDEIPSFLALDACRAEARELLTSGFQGLGGSTYEAHEMWEVPRSNQRGTVEHALIVRVLRIADARGLLRGTGALAALDAQLTEDLTGISTDSVSGVGPGETSVLFAGSALEALALIPGRGCSKAAVMCLYRALRELYSTERPLWTMGSARAGEGSRATAFVTGVCCRAILRLSRAFACSAEFCHAVHRTLQRQAELASIPRLPKEWRETELRRIATALEIDGIAAQPRGIFVLGDIGGGDFSEVASRIAAQIVTMCSDMTKAQAEIERIRRTETEGLVRSESPHQIAREAINQMRQALERVAAPLTLGAWAEAGMQLSVLVRRLSDHLEPCRSFLGAILDHELAAAATESADRDLPELACAAAAYGELQGNWTDPRLDVAAKVLVAGLSDSGRLATGRPFQVQPNGFRLHVAFAEVIRALASLFTHRHQVITPQVANRFLRLFRDSQRDVPGGVAWCSDAPIDPRKASWWVSALSIIALDQVQQMIDSCLNERIALHFTGQRVPPLNVDLDAMFYPDYGLTRVDRESVAIHMQHMRAHLLGIRRDQYRASIVSIVLYGPPGTGKTTMAQALARSSKKRFIQITPSDIVLGGAEHAEHRARAVFQALAMLTDTVILFDEFDSLLRRRPTTSKVLQTIFQLLTPGMLPKIETLHVASRSQRVAFILSTNLVGSLDEAAIRDGRFDEKTGVYPPDLVSRLGRLLSVRRPLTPEQERRLLWVCAMTHDAPMSTLGQHGWFTADPHPRLGSGQAYIDDETQVPRWPTPEFHEIKRSGEGKHADVELAEWMWSRTTTIRLAGGPPPMGDLAAYVRSVGWRDIRKQLSAKPLDWKDITAALDARPEWEPFFTWVMLTEDRALGSSNGNGTSPPGDGGRVLGAPEERARQ